ncbi:MAG: hypothetical protein ABSA58_22910 [Acetobacteraceae bacterium]|jgi:hypothetical protein
MAARDDDLPDVERATGEEGQASASVESPKGDIAEAWREEFDEELTWGGLVRWLDETE